VPQFVRQTPARNGTTKTGYTAHTHRTVTASQERFPAPKAWYDRFVTQNELWEDCHGVPLAVAAFAGEATIHAQIRSALDLIAAYAPAEFNRIATLMRGIIVTRCFGARGEWRQSLNACVISTHFLRSEDATPASVAGTIIHELMHARLDAIGFDYREERRARIERICYRRSQRFLESLPVSNERTAAFEEVEAGLSLDSAEWSTAVFWRRKPWFLRVLRFLVVQLPTFWHRHART
jgi:hypothetical protein